MAEKTNTGKDQAMEMAEDARQKEWKYPSFTAELFRGRLRWDLMHPFPKQSPEDKKIGDEYIEKLRKVLEQYVDPIEIDRTGEYPKEALMALADIGAFGMKIDKKYGGLGFSITNYSRVLSFVGSYCQSTVTWLSAHQSIGVPQPLKSFGTEEQKQKYLPRLAKGEISAFALTELDVGSDPARMGTMATPSEDGQSYYLNGEKLWCTNGTQADIIVVMTQTPPKIVHGKERKQISAFIVEASSPGYEVEYRCNFMGLKGIGNGVIKLNNVKVPKENLIGKEGEGLKIALTTLNTGRLGIPATCAGSGKAVLKMAEKWINERVQWGVPIGKHQSIAKKVANIAADTFAMDAVVGITSAMADQEKVDIRLEAAISKYFCTETSWKVLDDFLQVRGGRGFETAQSLHGRGEDPMPVERLLRDARIGRIFEGSSEVMHLILAREAMDTHFKLIMPLLQPKPGQKESKLSLLLSAAKFYIGWYPRTFIPSGVDLSVKHLNSANRDHLAYTERACRKLARRLFHTMGKYQAALEYEQLLLANFVDIGVDLFVMNAALSYAESLVADNPADQTPQELANLYCENARKRIAANFLAVKKNHNKLFKKVTGGVMEGKYHWMQTDVYGDYPPDYRRGSAASGSTSEVAEPVAK